MSKSNVFEVFKYIQLCLVTTGIWPKPDATFLYKLKGLICYCLSAIFIAFAFTQIYLTFNGIASVSYSLFLNLAITFYLPKVAIFYYNRKEFFKILKNFNQAIFQDYRDDLDFYIVNQIRIFTRLQLGFQVLCVSTLFLVGVIPFLGTDFKRELPIPFPFDISQESDAVYVLFWIIQFCILNLSALNNSALDILACSFMGIGSAHLKILREKLTHVADMTSENLREEKLEISGHINKKILRKIKNCVKHHGAIERLLNSTERTFTYMFLVQFLSSVSIICITGFTFVLVPLASVQFGVSLLFFGCVTVQLAIYCTFGNEVMIQSSRIRDACYMSEWNNCETGIRKCLFIIMERSKRPFILTAGKFTPLTLNSLIMVLKSAFSYFAVLQKLYKKAQEDTP